MKYAILLISLVFVSTALGEQSPDPRDQAYWKSLNMRAFYVTGENGRKVLVVTNLDRRGRRMGGEIAAAPQSRSRVQNQSIVLIPTGRSTTIADAGSTRIPMERLGSASVGSSRPLVLNAPSRGVPACLWKGQWVSPVVQGNRLVCPDDSSPYAVTPR